ncbi:MAG: hypothetical protein ACREJT_14820, partial [Myxococcota bacterium]
MSEPAEPQREPGPERPGPQGREREFGVEVLVVAVVVAGGGFVYRWSRRRPGVPMKWQTSQSVAADLHRRMHRSVDRTRNTVAEARKRGVPTSGYEGLCDRLAATARAVDDQLVL